MDAQLSHSDPNQVSAAYNHAMYVGPRRKMMQDWADRLDLLEQGEVAAASTHLTIRIDGVPMLDESDGEAVSRTVLPVMVGVPVHRLLAVPARPVPEPVIEVAVSDLRRGRMEMLAAYEAPDNLPVVQFAKLAGKSKDQVNREIKAGKLLTISLGNRGQRIPEWQLDPLKQRLAQSVMKRLDCMGSWQLYRALMQSRESLGGSAIELVSAANLNEVIAVVCCDLMSRNTPLLETA